MNTIIDTGPLIAYFDRNDYWHEWTSEQFNRLTPPLFTCEAVITEVLFLLLRQNLNPDPIFKIENRGFLVIQSVFTKTKDQRNIQKIITNYHDLPASFADACLVAMHMDDPNSRIFTLDHHFNIYRAGRKKIPVIMP
ncbi:MAG TPA: PIN domain-containing protein [Balneolales bacterium]|nr:PIN domain-containing protein [Balneolales bacterium]